MRGNPLEIQQSLLRTLGARFDTTALRPFDGHWPTAEAVPDWPALRGWLDQSADPGASPRAPAGQPMGAVACCAAENDDVNLSRAFRAAAALGLWLDGSLALADRRGPTGRLALRLRVKLQDAASALTGRPHAVWDCGHVPDEPAAWRALAAFAPRRASFVVVQAPAGGDPAAGAPAQQAVQALMTRQDELARPVRLLVLGRPWPDLQAVMLPGPGRR